jgi:hypothetical protein
MAKEQPEAALPTATRERQLRPTRRHLHRTVECTIEKALDVLVAGFPDKRVERHQTCNDSARVNAQWQPARVAACQRIERQWREEALLHYFVSARARTAMIQAFFRHVSRPRVERSRRELTVAPPAKPSALTRGHAAPVARRAHRHAGISIEEGQQSVRIDLAEQTPAALTDENLVEHAEPA